MVALDLGQLVDDLLALEGGEPPQLHVQDGLGLHLVDVEQHDQALARDLDRLRGADQRDDLVQRVERLDVAAQDVGPLLGLAQPVAGAPDDDLDLVADVVAHHLVEPQRARHAVDDRQHVDAEAVLQLGVLVEVVEHHLGDGVALERDHDAHADAVGRLVVDLRDAGELAVAVLAGDRLDQVVRVDLVGQLGDDEDGAALGVLLDLDHGAHPHRAAAGAVGLLDAVPADDETEGGEVGALDALHERGEQLLVGGLPVVQRPHDAGADLAQVVRRDVGGHPDGDADAAVDQQVRHPRRQDVGLAGAAVVVVGEVDGVLVDVLQHRHRERREPALRVVADEAVGDEGVVVRVDPEAVDGFGIGRGDRPDRQPAEGLDRWRVGYVPGGVDRASDHRFGSGNRVTDGGLSQDGDHVARHELLGQLPEQPGRAVHERAREKGVVPGAPDRSIPRVHPEHRVRSRVVDRGDADRRAVQTDHLDVHRHRGVAPDPRREIGDGHAAVGQGHLRVAGDAVPHRRGRVVAPRAEVALPVDQGVPQRPRLGQPDQRVVDG